jgi:nitroreductase
VLTVWDAIKTRRSIRKFLPDDIPDEMAEQMLEAARLLLSSFLSVIIYKEIQII